MEGLDKEPSEARLPLEDQRALVALIEPPKSTEQLAAEQGWADLKRVENLLTLIN